MGNVVVAARLQLVAQAVGAALRGRGVAAEPVAWTRVSRKADGGPGPGDVVVLLDDLVSDRDLQATCELISGISAPCVVLTGRRAGPAWGALLVAGAAVVMATDGSLEQIEAVLTKVAAAEPTMDEDRRLGLMSEWEEWRAHDEQLRARVARLSPREEQILVMLSEGCSVAEIISALGVAETTVRSQIKSMRRKLGVDSQLGAVAVLHRVGLPARSRRG